MRMMFNATILLLLTTCGRAEAVAPAPIATVESDAPVVNLQINVPMPERLVAAEPVDDYEGAENWCHEITDLPPCRRGDDVRADDKLPTTCTPDPRTGRIRICVDPWWVAGHERLCVPSPLGKKGRAQGRAELLAYVYRREGGQHRGICRPQRWWRWGKGHQVEDGYCNPESLEKVVRLVSWRETKHDDEKSHLDDRDKEAAADAWERRREVFADVNAHYWEPWRWKSRGRYGQNPALHLDRWDASAPPEALCNFVVATETYLEGMRDCYGTLHHLRGGKPDWWDLHHCASGGKFNRPDVIPTEEGTFYARAHSSRIRLDPFEKVPRSWLGEPIPHTMQAVSEIEQSIAEHLERKGQVRP